MTPPTALLWSYLSGGLAYLVVLALFLVVLSGLRDEDARTAASMLPAVVAVAALAYVAVGFAFEFGGVGLMDARHGFSELVWEWSALPEQWGPYWGMAGFAGWFLGRGTGTPEAVALFFGHLPWTLAAALVPALVVRRRVPAVVVLILAAMTGGVLAPLAGNWVHGGGWLARLGTTLGWGHGYVDFAGSGQVGLVGGGVGLAALLAFRLRRPRAVVGQLPAVHLPVFAAVGALLFVVGTAGWALNNPLYDVNALPVHRVLTNALLGVMAGAALPALYVWFVTGTHHPHLPVAGGYAGWLAVLAGLPFLEARAALGVGLAVGVIFPFAMYLVREVARLDDPAGVVTASLLGGVVGPLAVGFLADGRYGAGWNAIGHEVYLGVEGQGVSGLWVAAGFQPDWPGQVQAQLAGVGAQFLWAFLLGSVVCVALALLDFALQQVLSATPAQEGTAAELSQAVTEDSEAPAAPEEGAAEAATAEPADVAPSDVEPVDEPAA